MIACGKEDRDLREKSTEGDEGFKTLECLRGRLQAERQASRSAKRDAELMGSKLAELEKQLKQELRLKKRAEKKLILLKKKLQSIKASEQEQEQSKSQITNPETPQKMEDNASESSSSNSNSKSTETSSCKSTQSYESPKINRESFSTSSMASKSEIEMDGGDFVDDTWALVPVTWPAAVEPRVVNESVDEVLDVLRRAREGLKCCMERRSNFIRVGPACN